MSYTEIPYDFDLLYDIKSLEQLHQILLEDRFDDNMSDLFELIDHYQVPLPSGYKRPFKIDFPAVVWIDSCGRYIDHIPTVEESYKYQKMKRFV